MRNPGAGPAVSNLRAGNSETPLHIKGDFPDYAAPEPQRLFLPAAPNCMPPSQPHSPKGQRTSRLILLPIHYKVPNLFCMKKYPGSKCVFRDISIYILPFCRLYRSIAISRCLVSLSGVELQVAMQGAIGSIQEKPPYQLNSAYVYGKGQIQPCYGMDTAGKR